MPACAPRPDAADSAQVPPTRLQLMDAATDVYRIRLALLAGHVSPVDALAACVASARLGGDDALLELEGVGDDVDPVATALDVLAAIGDVLEVALAAA